MLSDWAGGFNELPVLHPPPPQSRNSGEFNKDRGLAGCAFLEGLKIELLYKVLVFS